MTRNDFFQALRSEVQRRNQDESRQESFEQRVVKYLLRTAGVTAPAPRDADLAWFRTAYPRFPVNLMAQKVPWTHSVTGAALFGEGFHKLPFAKAFVDQLQEHDWDLERDFCGLVFAWPKVKGGNLMILHNFPPEGENTRDAFAVGRRGSCLVREFGKPPVRYALETFQDCILRMGADWAE